MIYHKPGNGTSTVVVPRNISGYDILGIADITLDTTSVNFASIQRNPDYTVNMGVTVSSGNDIQFTLYTGNKYFDANKQGRGITDCFQMVEVLTDETPTGSRTTFTINAGNRPILALGSYATYDGTGYAYPDGTNLGLLVTSNRNLPESPVNTIEFQIPPAASINRIPVPVLVHTAVESSEDFAFFYQYVPYQGLLDSTAPYVATGAIEAQGPAITTTAGSGAITNYAVSPSPTGYFTGTKEVFGIGTDWSTSGKVHAGYLLASTTDSTKRYKVESIASDTLIYLTSPSDRSSTGTETFSIVAPDLPLYSYPNIMDRLPTLHTYNDHSGVSTPFSSLSASCIESKIVARIQDITEVPANTIQAGKNSADRGMSTVNIPGALYGRGNLGLIYETVGYDYYTGIKKTYQSYLLNKSNTGHLYLMVVGSETDNNTTGLCKFNEFSDNDSVDIFAIPGRPIIANRIQ